MCGIVGAAAQRNISQILLEGLRRLEYRGYDSAGMAIINPADHTMQTSRVLGKVEKLTKALEKKPLPGQVGIAHTRWATHGEPNKINAHPHCSQQQIAVVHNGIIENYETLKEKLIAQGYQFASQTDTEVIGHLLHFHYQSSKDMVTAIRNTASELEGAYALGIICNETPDQLFAIRCGSPLVVGVGIGEHFIASDPLALLPVTQKFIYPEEGDIIKITREGCDIADHNGKSVKRKVHITQISSESTSKGNYRHFMQKEIFEQPQSISETIDGHILKDHLVEETFGHKAKQILQKIKRVQIIACGTSFHAGLVGKYWLESIAQIPCQVEVASENRYRPSVVEPGTLFVAISQSGETADTLAALRRAKESGYAATLSICNVPQSTLVRESDLVFITHSGTEIGVAATKTFTSQLIALLLLTLVFAQHQSEKQELINTICKDITKLPKIIQQTLVLDETIKKLSKQFEDKQHALFLGRGNMHAIAKEGALKLKEISYIHAEAYPAGELKHGPLALVDKDMPVIVVAPYNELTDKLASNVREVQARGGILYIFADERSQWKDEPNLTVINMPKISDVLAPVAYTIPLQLLSYHIAVLKGTDVDQPRNLAKSVTVE